MIYMNLITHGKHLDGKWSKDMCYVCGQGHKRNGTGTNVIISRPKAEFFHY